MSTIYKLRDGYGVCVGGRFDGWLMRKHPDGQWVSVEKLELEAPKVPAFLQTAKPAAPIDTGALRELLAKATPGPWERVDTPDYAEVRAPGLYSPVALVGGEHECIVC